MKKSSAFLLIAFAFSLTSCTKDPFANSDSGTLKDSRDNHEYHWVRVGAQIWLSENLAYLPAVSSPSTGSDTDPVYFVYDFANGSISDAKTKPNFATYGVLYNWKAATTACPSGWHLPNDSDWKALESSLGMDQKDLEASGWRESGSIGKALKTATGWNNKGNGDNSSGFTAMPGGSRTVNGEFFSIGNYAYFWSATGLQTGKAGIRGLSYGDGGMFREDDWDACGYSVRCLRN